MPRPLVTLLLLCACAAAARAAPPPAADAGTLIVLNKSDATAWLLDPDSGARLAELPTGAGPHEVAVSPDGATAVVCDYGAQAPGATLTVIDLRDRRVVDSLDLGEHRRPHGVAFLPGGERVAVTSEASRHVVVVDLARRAVVTAAPTEQDGSHMLALSPDGARAYVANIISGSMSVVDLQAGALVKVVPTGGGAEGIAVTPDGREVWVGNRDADTVSVVDAGSLEVVATLQTGGFPLRVQVTPDGRTALVSCARAGEVAVYDVASRAERARISMATINGDGLDLEGRMVTGFGHSPVPIGILVTPDGRRAYVANTNANVVTVLDLAALRVAARLPTGRQPDGMAWSVLPPTPPWAPQEGEALEAMPDLFAVMTRLRAGAEVSAVIRRDGEERPLTLRMREKPRERADDLEIEYGAVAFDEDTTLRTIVARPRPDGPHGPGPYAAVLMLPGLTCYSQDAGTADPVHVGRLAHDLARRGLLTMRVEKSGVGDSTGPPCSEIDFETEAGGYLAGLRQLKARPEVDPSRVFLFRHSMGGLFGPWVGEREPVAGIAVYGTGVRNWLEYMLDNNRKQMLLGGASWAEANDASASLSRLLAEFHVRERPLPEIIAEFPELRAWVTDETHYTAGRHHTFFRQLGRLNAPRMWERSGAHALAIHGAADFISDRRDHEAIVDAVRPGQGRFVALPRSDHFICEAEDEADALARLQTNQRGPFNADIVDLLVDWIAEVTAAPL